MSRAEDEGERRAGRQTLGLLSSGRTCGLPMSPPEPGGQGRGELGGVPDGSRAFPVGSKALRRHMGTVKTPSPRLPQDPRRHSAIPPGAASSAQAEGTRPPQCPDSFLGLIVSGRPASGTGEVNATSHTETSPRLMSSFPSKSWDEAA